MDFVALYAALFEQGLTFSRSCMRKGTFVARIHFKGKALLSRIHQLKTGRTLLGWTEPTSLATASFNFESAAFKDEVRRQVFEGDIVEYGGTLWEVRPCDMEYAVVNPDDGILVRAFKEILLNSRVVGITYGDPLAD